MTVLTDDDRRFFEENGYVVVHNAVPQENLDATIAAIFDFLEMNPDNPSDWYRKPLPVGGMVELYQHQALWDNRQNERLYGAFRDLFQNEKLWVSFDRVNLKPPRDPAHPEYDHTGFMHWDTDIATRHNGHFGVQGVLYLTDTDADMGGFRCVPGHHKLLDEWVERHGTKRWLTDEQLGELNVTPIVGKAGDLIIWNRLLLHGNGHNVSQKPRLAQFITMYPHPTDWDASMPQREDRIRQWREHSPPCNDTFPGDSRQKEQQSGKTAALTELGRKLLGAEAW